MEWQLSHQFTLHCISWDAFLVDNSTWNFVFSCALLFPILMLPESVNIDMGAGCLRLCSPNINCIAYINYSRCNSTTDNVNKLLTMFSADYQKIDALLQLLSDHLSVNSSSLHSGFWFLFMGFLYLRGMLFTHLCHVFSYPALNMKAHCPDLSCFRFWCYPDNSPMAVTMKVLSWRYSEYISVNTYWQILCA